MGILGFDWVDDSDVLGGYILAGLPSFKVAKAGESGIST
jgi:hypothetical protein